jgi:hypothetical protein
MAVTFQSVQTTAFASGTTVVITKPVSLAVGDLMIGSIFFSNGSISGTPSGWSSIRSDGNPGTPINTALYYKVADSGDVAASDFTWTISISVDKAGSITRITGQDTVTPISNNNGSNIDDTSTPSLAIGVTPTVANSLLLQYWYASSGTTAIGSYAIANSNPSWTEAYDLASSTTYDISMAYASRPETTDTGNVSAAGGGGGTDWVGQIVVIAPAAVGPASIKTVNGLSIASVKTVNGLAIASVKTINGLS